MKIAVIGNFPPDGQESMQRFAGLLVRGLEQQGHTAPLLAPVPHFSRLVRARPGGLPKFLGYLDKLVLFPRELRRQLGVLQPDVVHIVDHGQAPCLSVVPHRRVVVTCHDLLPFRVARGEFPPQRVSWPGRRLLARIARALVAAPAIACVSTQTRHDLLRLTARGPDRTWLVPNGLNYPYRPLPAAVARQIAVTARPGRPLPERFLLHVGTDSWYKNRPGLLRIFAALAQREPSTRRLVLAGPPLNAADAALARKLQIADRVEAFPGVANELLEALYNLAEALVFPSHAEGFGWPVVEAQACGCPVYTTKLPPLTEIGGDAAWYLDPGDVDGAAALLQATLLTPAHRAAGLRNSARYSADRMIAAYLERYHELAAAPGAEHNQRIPKPVA